MIWLILYLLIGVVLVVPLWLGNKNEYITVSFIYLVISSVLFWPAVLLILIFLYWDNIMNFKLWKRKVK